MEFFGRAKRKAKNVWQELAAGASGAEIAEAALVLPLAFMLLMGILWFVTCVCDYVHGKSVAFSTDCMLQLCTWKSHKFHLSYIAQFIASLFCD